MAQKGGPCYRGQQLLDKRSLSSCRESLSQGTTVPDRQNFSRPAWALHRHASGSPFGSNGDDRRQRRKQGGAVGTAASRMQATAKQTLGAATRPWREAPERANKNRAAGNVRTCGAVYLLEEIVLVENGFLNPVGTIKIVYFIWRKKSTRVVKIRGTCSFAQNKTP